MDAPVCCDSSIHPPPLSVIAITRELSSDQLISLQTRSMDVSTLAAQHAFIQEVIL